MSTQEAMMLLVPSIGPNTSTNEEAAVELEELEMSIQKSIGQSTKAEEEEEVAVMLLVPSIGQNTSMNEEAAVELEAPEMSIQESIGQNTNEEEEKEARWLILQGRLKEAQKVLNLVSNNADEAQTRFVDIKKAIGLDENMTDDIVKLPGWRKTQGQEVWKELILRPLPSVRRILLVAIAIHFFEHATGIEAVILYGPRIFKKAGVTTKSKLLLATIGVGLIKLICNSASSLLLDRVGRRKLLLTSIAGMIISLTLLGTCLTFIHHSSNKLYWALVVSLMATYLYVMFFQLGLAPVTWIYSSKIFPLKLRAQGFAIGVAVNRLMNAVISMTFLSISEAITIGGAFYMFGVISVIAWVFFLFLLSLEDMEALFSRRRPATDTTNRSDVIKDVEIA